LVIFLKPTIIRNPSIDSDLEEYKKYLTGEYNPSNSAIEQGEDAL